MAQATQGGVEWTLDCTESSSTRLVSRNATPTPTATPGVTSINGKTSWTRKLMFGGRSPGRKQTQQNISTNHASNQSGRACSHEYGLQCRVDAGVLRNCKFGIGQWCTLLLRPTLLYVGMSPKYQRKHVIQPRMKSRTQQARQFRREHGL